MGAAVSATPARGLQLIAGKREPGRDGTTIGRRRVVVGAEVSGRSARAYGGARQSFRCLPPYPRWTHTAPRDVPRPWVTNRGRGYRHRPRDRGAGHFWRPDSGLAPGRAGASPSGWRPEHIDVSVCGAPDGGRRKSCARGSPLADGTRQRTTGARMVQPPEATVIEAVHCPSADLNVTSCVPASASERFSHTLH